MIALRSFVFAALAASAAGCIVHERADVVMAAPVAVEVDQAPPPPPATAVVVTPRAGFVWIPGRHVYRGRQWVWVEGRWERDRAGYAYRPGAWRQYGHRWRYVEGGWERRPVVRDHRYR